MRRCAPRAPRAPCARPCLPPIGRALSYHRSHGAPTSSTTLHLASAPPSAPPCAPPQVLRLLKYDKRVPSRTPPPPSPVRTFEEQAVLDEEEAQRIALAVDTARVRAASPPPVDNLVSHRAEMRAQVERRAASVSPSKSPRPSAEARSAPTALRTKPALPRKGVASSGGPARPLTDGPRSTRSPPSSERGKGKGTRLPKWDGKPRTAATPGATLASPTGASPTGQRSQQGSHRSSSGASSKPRKGRAGRDKSPGPKRLEFEEGGGS